MSVPPGHSWRGIKRDESEERVVGGNGHFIMPAMECVLFVYLVQQVVEINLHVLLVATLSKERKGMCRHHDI